MHRFIVRAAALAQDSVTLEAAHARQIAVVLRMQPGDEITLVAGGSEARASIESVSPERVVARIRDRIASATEPTVELTLALPLLRGDRSEEVVEAVTQLGVARILPYVSTRSVVRALGDAKRERWERIARESAETARRGRAPAVGTLRTWDELFDVLPRPIVIAWEGERDQRLRDALPKDLVAFSLVIGPEGGLAEEEIALARANGAIVVSLGRRNLRAETAAIAAVAIAMDVVD
ncbi:MAG: 16S rRNA (uracil(1498)-N(3))-methyltransferase [Chloroflexi bacterium]|nr:MAG: 16S rRNA (uracil(1498)-N(3))-methyltransferase [Chloroflexota bacterium]TMB80897.1 MAG: 16S rRNA (uracil(1498)-N(3))-methyltransferase [Chloroflexota bacterium]TMB94469.1 MAG: 16S rRNA (uracil(1498)-N(3))-methyltransferase [Chloroflexota bacterium]TMC27735.1 MAG: 16S rRNA (uracil(1498)-N(3))-methyltransferase [Chloroflexota bacterium]